MSEYIFNLRKRIGHETLFMPSVSTLVLNDKNQVLCMRRSPERLLGVFGNLQANYPNDDKVEFVTTFFLCKVVGGKLKAQDGEALELEFFDMKNIPSSPLFDRLPIPLTELIKKKEAMFVWNSKWLENIKI